MDAWLEDSVARPKEAGGDRRPWPSFPPLRPRALRAPFTQIGCRSRGSVDVGLELMVGRMRRPRGVQQDRPLQAPQPLVAPRAHDAVAVLRPPTHPARPEGARQGGGEGPLLVMKGCLLRSDTCLPPVELGQQRL